MSRNLVSRTTGILVLSIWSVGSQCIRRRLQKCRQTVFVLENLKPFSSAHFCKLLRICCSCLSMKRICLDRQQENHQHIENWLPGCMRLTMPFILRLNKLTDNMLPWGHPFPAHKHQKE